MPRSSFTPVVTAMNVRASLYGPQPLTFPAFTRQ
jgi:hypothetical protein